MPGVVRDAGGVSFVAARIPLPDEEPWLANIRKLVAHYDIKDHERYAQHIFTGLQAVGPYFAVINDCQHETIDMLEGYKCVGDRFLEEEQ